MKKLLFAFLPCLFQVMATAADGRTPVTGPKLYAVIVGVSHYSDATIVPLRYAHRDAESYKAFLQTPMGGSIPEEDIAMLTNEKATRAAILHSVREMCQKATPDDVIVFFYSGHGVPDSRVSSDLYFVTYDTQQDNYLGTALYKEDIIREINHSQAKLRLFLVDACHSGGSGIYLGKKGDDAELVNKLFKDIADIKAPAWAAITASSSAESSYEDKKWGDGHGVFTYELIKGLEGEADMTTKKNPKANGNGDGIVTARELYDYLNKVIPGETTNNQHPDIQGNYENLFPLSAVSLDKYAKAVNNYKPSGSGQATSSPGNGLQSREDKPQFDTSPKDLDIKICTGNGRSFGQMNFINDYGEDLILVGAYCPLINTGKVNLMMAQGESANPGNLGLGYYSNMTFTGATSTSATFYFRTADETKPIRYGTRIETVEVCKLKTVVVSRKNLYLSATGNKF